MFLQPQNASGEERGDFAVALGFGHLVGWDLPFVLHHILVKRFHFRSRFRSDNFTRVRFTTGLASVPNNITP